MANFAATMAGFLKVDLQVVLKVLLLIQVLYAAQEDSCSRKGTEGLKHINSNHLFRILLQKLTQIKDYQLLLMTEEWPKADQWILGKRRSRESSSHVGADMSVG